MTTVAEVPQFPLRKFCPSPCPAVRQQKLLSCPRFGAPKADIPVRVFGPIPT